MKHLIYPLLILFSYGSFAKDFDMDIGVDKGTVDVIFSPGVNSPEINYTKPYSCNAELIVNEGSESIKISHSEAYCKQGYHIRIKLPVELNSTIVKLRNGIINFSDFNYIKSLNSSVDAGMISSSHPGVKIYRTADYSGAKAEFLGQGNITLNLKVESGMISH